MRSVLQISALIATSLVGGGVCAYAQQGAVKEIQDAAASGVKEVKEAAQTAVYDITDKQSSVVEFNKGSAELSQGQVSKLRSMLNAFKDDASIKEIVVVAWSDLPYPRGGDQGDQPKKSRELAENRGKSIEKMLADSGGKHIKVYNMAEKANWFEKTFATHDAELKREANKTASSTDPDDVFYQALGRRVTAVGGPGKAVIVMRGELLPVSH